MDSPFAANVETKHLVIEIPSGQRLEHQQVPTSETLWNILCQFQSKYNLNLCRKHNSDNRYELPQLLYNSYPFASTLKQLLSTKLSDVTRQKRNKSNPITLRLIFKAQAFSIKDLEQRVSQIQTELKRQEKKSSSMDVDTKLDDTDDEDMNQTNSKLDRDFAKDIDAAEALSTEQIFRKMERFLYELTKSLTTKQEFIACMKLLKKIVNNLVLHPIDQVPHGKGKDPHKYRKLNLKNAKLQANLFKFDAALDLLRLIGFEDCDSDLILPKQNENMVVFQALVVKISNCQPPKAAVPVVDKEVKVYVLEDVRKFKVEESRIIAQKNAEKAQSESSLASQHRIAAQKAYKKAHPTQLMGTDLRERMYGVQQKQYKYTLLHIEFPSKYVLEARFHPQCEIYKLFEFVASVLDPQVAAFKYELTLPPRQVIKNKRDEKYTFKSMGGMIPACTVRFVLGANTKAKYDGNYIKNEVIQKYLTKDITSLRQVDAVKEETKVDGDSNTNTKQNTTKKSGKMTAAEFKAMKRKKALQAKLRKLNQK
eukprot:59590_1